MSSSETEEGIQSFVTTLESFKELKSGISASRIKKLTTYSLDHVDQEEQLISLIVEYSKTCPDSHKLGSLYIIDSIGRAYLDEARYKEEYIKPTAKSGSCAHGVYLLGEAIRDLLSEAISKSSDDHKNKIRTLIDIWDRAGLFQKNYLNSIRARFFAMAPSSTSTTSTSKNVSSTSLPEDPKERCTLILNNLTPLRQIPNVNIPEELSLVDDPTKQHTALLQLLKDIQAATQFVQMESQSVVAPPPPKQVAHITAEYGSRRDRVRDQRGGRNRSRSPRARRNSSTTTTAVNNGVTGDGFSTVIGGNNHHLYPNEMNIPSNPHFRPKPVSYDPSIPPNHVKVFSRTLFIGGVPMNMKEWDLSNLLRPYAEAQSIIMNNHRKHAFVKVYSRPVSYTHLDVYKRQVFLI